MKEQGEVVITDLIEHIDHFCSLGGEKQIGLGSDFDGISSKIVNLEDASMHPNLLNELLKNTVKRRSKVLPTKTLWIIVLIER